MTTHYFSVNKMHLLNHLYLFRYLDSRTFTDYVYVILLEILSSNLEVIMKM